MTVVLLMLIRFPDRTFLFVGDSGYGTHAVARFCHRHRDRLAPRVRRNAESLPIRSRLTDEEVAKFAANRFRYEGVEIKARLFRQYPFGDVGSHVIGYLGRVNKDDQAPILSIADLGIVGDVTKVLPALIEALKSRS